MAGTARAGTVAPARQVALRTLRRVFENGAHAHRALAAELDRAALGRRDRALATRLAYGATQRRGTLDALLERLAGRPAASLDAPLLGALRLGLYQLLYADGVADHAAVHESVEQAKEAGAGAARLANAVLRRASREREALLAELADDTTPEAAALAHSFPLWLARRWWRELGAARARSLMARANEPAENALRVNTLRAQPDAVAAALAQQGVAVRRAPDLPEGLIAEGAFDVFGSPQFRAGELLAQSRASMLVARVLAPAAGERVLDLCSAPGGKTTQIAALMGGAGEIVAVERDPKRAAELRETCARLGAAGARIEVRDAAEPVSEGAFDRVLVDPPCSGLGTLQSRPDLRWRATEERIAELVELQARIVARAAEALRPGGVLVYSTCTISAAENEEQIEALLSARRDLELDDLGDEHPELSSEGAPRCLQLLPDRDLTDGFFIARLRRAAA